jgi:serine/threonine protein kinase
MAGLLVYAECAVVAIPLYLWRHASIATACSSTSRYAATDELGRVLGPPADIYSLGVLLFELLSGK